MQGETVHGYVVVKPLGSGAMGAVYLAERKDIGRRAALKVQHERLIQDPASSLRFRNEARAANRVSHPGVVTVFDHGQLPNCAAFLLLEYLSGPTLATLIRDKRLPFLTALSIVQQAAAALDACHDCGVIHRDVKPGNLLCVPSPHDEASYRVVLLDLGIAKLVGDKDDTEALTHTGRLLGTVQYMPPEQARDAATVTDRADVYALGAVLYELLAGHPPAVMRQTGELTPPPPPVDAEYPKASAALNECLAQMIRDLATERPSAREVAESLSRIERQALAEATAPKSPRAAPASPASTDLAKPSTRVGKIRRAWFVAVSFAVGLILGGGVVGFVRQRGEQQLEAPPPKAASSLPEVSDWVQKDSGSMANLYGIWGSSPSDIWAVGDDCALAHYDGQKWLPQKPVLKSPCDGLTALWGSSAQDIWAVGHPGTLLHYNGNWTSVESGVSTDLYGIWGSSAQDIWVVGKELVLRYRGHDWEPLVPPTRHTLRAVWGSAPNDVWIVGSRDANHGVVLRHDGKKFAEPHPIDQRLRNVWGSGPNDVWIMATNFKQESRIHHFDGKAYTETNLGAIGWLSALSGTGPGDVWAMGSDGVVAHHNGASWNIGRIAGVAHIRGLFGFRRDDIWAAATSGTILHFAGRELAMQASGTNQSLTAIWASSRKDAWAVGKGGLLLRYEGQSWIPQQSSTDAQLRGVYGRGPNDLWAVGDAGTVLHGDGNAWTVLKPPTQQTLYGVWADAKGTAWVVGEQGVIAKWEAGMWKTLPPIAGGALRAIWGRSDRDIYCVGEGGAILHFDGTSWQQTSAAELSGAELMAVWGPASSPSELWVVGKNGLIAQRRGSTWQRFTGQTLSNLWGLWGGPAQDVWAVGDGGLVLHFDGKETWTKVPSGTKNNLLGVSGAPEGGVWVVGQLGTILH